MPWRLDRAALGDVEASPAGDRGAASADEEHPQAEEVFCEIGMTIAGFLAIAVAMSLVLDTLGY